MEKRIVWFSLIIAALLFLGMGSITYNMYQAQAQEINKLHKDSAVKNGELKKLSVEISKSKEQILKYEKQVKELQNQVNVQKSSIQEVKNRVNF